MASPQAVRRFILTGSVTAITVMGTIYGASLKEGQAIQQKRRQAQQATPDELIAQLQVTRSELVKKKTEMERKIALFRQRRQEKEQGIEPQYKTR